MLSRAVSKLPPELEATIYRVIGCALQVHKTLGPGYLEPVYHKAMQIELKYQGFTFKTEHVVNIRYRDQVIHGHRIDLVIEDRLIVELKAVEKLAPIHTAQLLSYLRATKLTAGLLINFNTDWLRGSIKRVVL